MGRLAQAVDDAQLGLADAAVVLQAAGDAVRQVGAATETVDAVGRHDLPGLDGLVDGLHVGAPVVEAVAIIVLHPCRWLVEIGGFSVGVALAEVAVVLLLVVQATFDGERGAGLPGERAEQAMLPLVPHAALARQVAGGQVAEGHAAVVFVAVVVQPRAEGDCVGQLHVQVRGKLAHVAVIAIVAVAQVAATAVHAQLVGGHEPGFVGFVVVRTRGQAHAQAVVQRAVEPLAAQRIFLRGVVVAVAVAGLGADEIVLGEAIGFTADCQLRIAGVVAAVGQARIGVAATLARTEVHVAADVVQAIARIVGTAHYFDVADVEREQHVDEALVAAVDVAGDAIDQRLDGIEVALTVEGAEADLARFSTLPGFGELDAGHLPEQFPAVRDVAVFNLVCTQDVHRGQHLVRTELAFAVLVYLHLAEGERGVGRLCEGFRGERCGREGGHQGGSLHGKGQLR